MKNKFLILLLVAIAVLATSCKTKEVPGRRRAPRHCNTCTKWSYVPQDTLETDLLEHHEG